MSIMLEAFEFHQIEQRNRKERYFDEFRSEINHKLSNWKVIQQKRSTEEKLSFEDLLFLINLTRESLLSSTIPYYENLLYNTKFQEERKQFLLDLKNMIMEQGIILTFMAQEDTTLRVKKKILINFSERAKKLSQSDDYQNILKSLSEKKIPPFDIDERLKELSKIENLIRKGDSLDEASTVWILKHSESSLSRMIETGNDFFDHHFNRIEKVQSVQKLMDDCVAIFFLYNDVIIQASYTTPKFLKSGEVLRDLQDEIKRSLRKVKWEYTNALQVLIN